MGSSPQPGMPCRGRRRCREAEEGQRPARGRILPLPSSSGHASIHPSHEIHFSCLFSAVKSACLPPKVLRRGSRFPTPSRSPPELLDFENKIIIIKKKVFPLFPPSSPCTKSPQPVFICPELYLPQLFAWKCNQSPFRRPRPLQLGSRTAALPSASSGAKPSNATCRKEK